MMEKGRIEFNMKKHRIDSESEYNSYKLAKARCNNTNNRSYNLYGGRGIEFRFESYRHFRDSIGPRPSRKHSLDRYPNNNGHYEPGNVRWATQTEQSNNRRNNIYLTLRDECRLILQWAKTLNISGHTLRYRKYLGWCDECTLTIPLGQTGYKGCVHRTRIANVRTGRLMVV